MASSSALSPSFDEEWLYHLAGARPLEVKPTSVMFIGGEPANEDDLASLDALLLEYGARDEPEASPTRCLEDGVDSPTAPSSVPLGAQGEDDRCDADPLPPGSSDLESAITACEESLGLRASPSAAAPFASTLIDETLASAEDPRLSWGAFQAKRRIQQHEHIARKLASRVCSLGWEAAGAPELDKKFQFLHINEYLKKKESTSIYRQKLELFPLVAPEHSHSSATKLPRWTKLPPESDRSPLIHEVVTGARFASVAATENLAPSAWLFDPIDADVCCFSLDLHGERARRFLHDDQGAGSMVHRGFLRWLQRSMSNVSMAAVWVRLDAPDDAIRLYVVLRATNHEAHADAATVDACHRFHQNLMKHKVPCGKKGKPLKVSMEDMAAYLGMSIDDWELELEDRAARDAGPAIEDRDIWEFTPETGYASPEEIHARTERSYSRWNRRLEKLGLPGWLTHGFVEAISDHFLLSRDEVRERDQARARLKLAKRRPWKAEAGDAALVKRFEDRLVADVAENVLIYRGSPAQLAAVAIRPGEFLGSYCESRHKAGPAKELYERLRSGDS